MLLKEFEKCGGKRYSPSVTLKRVLNANNPSYIFTVEFIADLFFHTDCVVCSSFLFPGVSYILTAPSITNDLLYIYNHIYYEHRLIILAKLERHELLSHFVIRFFFHWAICFRALIFYRGIAVSRKSARVLLS